MFSILKDTGSDTGQFGVGDLPWALLDCDDSSNFSSDQMSASNSDDFSSSDFSSSQNDNSEEQHNNFVPLPLDLDFTSEDLANFDLEAALQEDSDLLLTSEVKVEEVDVKDQLQLHDMPVVASTSDFNRISKSSFPFLEDGFTDDMLNMELGSSAEDLMMVNPFELVPKKEPEEPEQDSLLNGDCMWSSSLNFLDDLSKRKRSRDQSLTLSECTETLSKDIHDIHSVLGEAANIVNGDLDLEEEPENTDEEEEIDVVSDCSSDANSSSSSTISCSSTGSLNSTASFNGMQRYHQIQAGRSLLRKSVLTNPQYNNASRFQHTPSAQTLIDHMNGDHCYFAMRTTHNPQETSSSSSRKTMRTTTPGMLTPNESSDDEIDSQTTNNIRTTIMNPALHGVATTNGNESETTDEDEDLQEHLRKSKFRFKMNFQNKENQHEQEEQHNQTTTRKRKSAIKNPHCPSQPSPTKRARLSTSSTTTVRLQQQQQQSAKKTISVITPQPQQKQQQKQQQEQQQQPSSTGGGPDQKCREIRDLHNSMERRRRVDLRINFDQLKETVPELRDVEKASKLNILNKSAEYCRSLMAQDSKLAKEKEREMNRRNLLKKKLLQLTAEYQCVKTTSSGRVSVLNTTSRHYSYY